MTVKGDSDILVSRYHLSLRLMPPPPINIIYEHLCVALGSSDLDFCLFLLGLAPFLFHLWEFLEPSR